jgi:hypothetical protein
MIKTKSQTSRTLLGLGAACLLAPAGLRAADTTSLLSPDSVRQILERLDKDEQEIKDLRSQLANRPSAPAPTTNATVSPDAQWQQRIEADETALTNLNSQITERNLAEQKAVYPNLQFHGFGDVDYAADNRKPKSVPGNATGVPYGVGYYGVKNTFYLGELDIFLTSQLADNVSVVSETALAADSNNNMQIDIERLYLEYRYNDYFNVDMGRFHTALGYYNATYHHGTWLQTAIGRPTFLQFEDSGGILPVHMVGVDVHGAIPSGSLNLSYYAEVGNGLDYSANRNVDAVQEIISTSDSKAVNVALVAKPDWMPGLQFGGNVYYDFIMPDNVGTTNNVPHNNQLIFGANLVYNNADWEFLNEGYLIADKPTGGQTQYDPAFYTQIARKFGLFTPYVRFNYYNIVLGDTLYALDWAGGVNAGVHYGPSVGLRFDFTTYAALKVQYDYLVDHGYNDASRINLQACFTF